MVQGHWLPSVGPYGVLAMGEAPGSLSASSRDPYLLEASGSPCSQGLDVL